MSDLSELLTVAHLSWATWAIRSQLLRCLERSERIPHSCSFDLSEMSEWANEWWANSQPWSWAVCMSTRAIVRVKTYLHHWSQIKKLAHNTVLFFSYNIMTLGCQGSSDKMWGETGVKWFYSCTNLIVRILQVNVHDYSMYYCPYKYSTLFLYMFSNMLMVMYVQLYMLKCIRRSQFSFTIFSSIL